MHGRGTISSPVAALSWHFAPRTEHKGTDQGEVEPKGRRRRGGSARREEGKDVRVSCNDAACSLPAAPAMHLPPFILLRTFSRRDFPRNLTTPRTVFHQLFLLAHSCILSLPLRAAVRLVYCTHRHHHHHHPLFICLHMRFLTLLSLPFLVSLPFQLFFEKSWT